MSAHRPADRSHRASYPPLALMAACFFLSGFLALCYEICWIRKASMAFGATNYALSTVLAVFFAGLAAGSYLLGKRSSTIQRPLRVYAYLEIGIGVLALLSPLAFTLGDTVFGWCYPLVSQSFWLLSLLRFVLVVVILFVPSLLIGGTFPLFCRQYISQPGRIARSVGFLYGVNTLGAACGCAICGIVLIPWLGINASIYLAGLLNVMLGGVVWLLTRHASPLPAALATVTVGTVTAATITATPTLPETLAQLRARQFMPWLFFLVGFVALGSEVVWTRYLSLLMQNTVYTYTLTLTVILLGIVLGSLLTARFFDRLQRRALVFGGVQIGYGVSVLAALLLPPAVWQGLLDTTNPLEQLGIAALILLIPAILSGVSFPLAIRMMVHDPALAGVGVGRMTALNTLGGILGSLAVGFVILPLAGLQITLLITTAVSLGIGFCAFGLEPALGRRGRLVIMGGSGLVWLAIPLLLGTQLPADFLAGKGQLVDFREGLSAQLAVVQENGVRRLEIDRLWQGEDRKTHQIAAAHVPMQFHPQAKDVAVIGLGPGQTASRFLMYDIQRLDCVDIEQKLIPLVRDHFESQWMKDDRVRFIVEDGRNYLANTDTRYDLISVEVGQVFRPGIASFYTAEFYREARDQLRDDGLLCQFVPISFFHLDEFRTVIATFVEVFPRSVLWYNRGELLLLGTTAEQLKLDAAGLARLQSNPLVRADLEFAYWGGPSHFLNQPEVFLSGFLAGPGGLERLAAGATIYHDDRPHLEYSAPSHQLDAHLVAIVEEIQRVADPLEAVLTGAGSGETVARFASIRQRNMGDIVATSIQKEIDLSSEAGRRKSVDVLQQALAWNPDNASIRMMLGNVHHFADRLDDASLAYRQALEINPNYAEAHNNLGQLLLADGHRDEGLKHLRRAVALKPTFAQAAVNLGVACQEDGATAEALVLFRRAVAGDPHLAEAHFQLGVALRNDGQTAEAVECFRAALEHDPTIAEYHYNLAAALRIIGDDDLEAQQHLQTAIQLRPDYPQAHTSLGSLLRSQGEIAKAIEHLQAAVRLEPGYAKAHFNLGNAFAAMGRMQEAVEQFREALRLQPDDPQTLNALGRALTALGELDDAITQYEKGLEIEPQHPQLRDNLAMARKQKVAPDGLRQ